MKIIRKVLIIMLCALLLAGCSAESVKLATEEVKLYVEQNFGNAKYLRRETREDSVTYYFQDEQFQFEYYVGSYRSNIGMDGTTFWYQETKRDNFHNKYCEAITKEVGGLKLSDNVLLELYQYHTNDNTIFAYAFMTEDVTLDEIVGTVATFCSKIRDLDNRRILKGFEIIIKDKNDEWLGKYKIYEQEYVSQETQTIEYYENIAEQIMGVKEINIYSSTSMPQADVPGLLEEKIANILGSDYSTVTCYYFTIGETKYFITDSCVMYGNSPKQYIYNITEGKSMVQELTKKY